MTAAPAVMSVTGPLAASELGRTYCHEHLVTAPSAVFRAGDDDLVLDDVEAAARDLDAFSSVGGGTIVEVSCAEFGRDPVALRWLSARTGVGVIAATGHVVEAQWAGAIDVGAMTEGGLTAEMVRDLVDGFPQTERVRAGVIKVGTSPDGVSTTERRVLRAAASAQRETGAAITTHAGSGLGGLEQIDLLERAAANLARVCIGHQDLRLDWNTHLEIVRRGCFIGYDSISKERYEPDAERIRFIARLVREGFGGQVLLSGDFARRSNHSAYGGGPGLTNIIGSFVPALLEAGLRDADIDALLVSNPARFLTGTGEV